MKFLLFLALAFTTVAHAERARELGVPFEGAPGPNNAITDVAGVEVGQVTRIEGDGPLKVGVILPRHLVQDIDTLEDWNQAELMYGAINRA